MTAVSPPTRTLASEPAKAAGISRWRRSRTAVGTVRYLWGYLAAIHEALGAAIR